jgi:hypothetical protein
MAILSLTQLIAGAVSAFLAYKVLIVVYRLTLHPLAKIPGPKLAAATSLYEVYFDVVKGGMWLFEIERLHKIYGTYMYHLLPSN